MNKTEKQILKDILSTRQEFLGCDGDREVAMIEYDHIDSIIRKLKLYQ